MNYRYWVFLAWCKDIQYYAKKNISNDSDKDLTMLMKAVPFAYRALSMSVYAVQSHLLLQTKQTKIFGTSSVESLGYQIW